MPRALQPYDPANAYGLTAAPQVQTIDLRRLMIALRRQRATILLPAVLMGAFGVVYAKTAPDTYSGYASLMLDSNMNGAIRQVSGIDRTVLPDDMIENARVVMMSDKLAFDVLDRTGLQADPAFMEPPTSGFSQMVGKAVGAVLQPIGWLRHQVDSLLASLGAQPQATAPTAAPDAGTAAPGAAATPGEAPIDPERLAAAGALQSELAIYRQGRSTAITVAYTAYDPETAARVANAYADAYVQDMLTANANAVGQTTAWMRGRLDELRLQAQAAAAEAEKFSTEHGLVGAVGGGLLTGQAVSELNTSLTSAIGDLARAQAVLDTYDKAVAGGVEGLVAGNDFAVGGEVSDTLAARINNYNDLRARLQRVTANSGAQSAQALGLRQTLSTAAQRLFVDLQAQQQEARSALAVAKARVDALQASLDEATRRNNAQAANMVKLDALQKEAATLSELYQSTLSKAQEIEQQQSFPVSNVRILSYAQPPLSPSGPSTKRAAAVMMILGLFFGILRAAIREARERFMRTASDVTDHSPLRFLGHLPVLPKVRFRTDRLPDPATRKLPEPPLVLRPPEGSQLPVVTHRRNPKIRMAVPVLSFPNSVYAETLRHVHLAASRKPEGGLPILGITSFHPYDNRASVALNFAAQFGLGREPVLLIDADSRGRALSRLVGLDAVPGLSDAAAGDEKWQDLLATIERTNVTVLPCGLASGGRADDLTTTGFLERLLGEAADTFGSIVIDVPPLYPVAQGRAILHDLPHFAIVAEWGRTPRELAELALADDPDLEARCIGVVYDRVNLRRLRRYLLPGAAENYIGMSRAYARAR